MIEHQADFDILQRIHDHPQHAAQHVEKCVGCLGRQNAGINQELALAVLANRGSKVRTIIQAEHDQGLAARRKITAKINIDIVGLGRRTGAQCQPDCEQQAEKPVFEFISKH